MYREQEVDMSKKHILKMSLLVLFLFVVKLVKLHVFGLTLSLFLFY